MNQNSLTQKLRLLTGAGVFVALSLLAPITAAQAGQADVLKAVAQEQGAGSWRFDARPIPAGITTVIASKSSVRKARCSAPASLLIHTKPNNPSPVR